MTVLGLGNSLPAASDGTVFIVDDDAEMRQSLSLLMQTVGLEVEAYASAQDFLDRGDPQKPGCLILDVRMPGMSGLELQKVLSSSGACPPIVFVTGHGEVSLATQAIRAGAVDFIQKPFSPQALLERTREALELDRQNRQRRALASDVQQHVDLLTPREREIMSLLAAGESTKHIGQKLSISSKTVDNHRIKILEKMNVENPTQLAHLLGPLGLAPLVS